MAKFFRVIASDAHFKYADRLASHSDGHKLFAEFPKLKDAETALSEWLATHKPQDRNASYVLEEISSRGDRYIKVSRRAERQGSFLVWSEG